MEVNGLLRLSAEQTTEHALLLLDRAGTVLWCNPAAANITGYTREELVGRPVHTIFTTEDVQQGIETARPLIAQRRHRFVEHVLGTPIVVNADSGRLEQVMVNLLTNAAKYTPEGGEIELRATMEQNEAMVHVRDNGIGIPSDMLPHIFELFTQGQSRPSAA